MSEFIGALIGLAGLLLGVLAWTVRSEKQGEKRAEGKQAKEVLGNVQKANEVRRDTERLSDDERLERMRERARK